MIAAMRYAMIVTVLLVAMGASHAAETAAEREIKQLLSFVENSGCTFIRNDQHYAGAAAREHLEMKYRHTHNNIETAEDFIRLVASGSRTSGKSYRVRCAGEEQTSEAWLRSELTRLRSEERKRTVK